MQQPKKLNQKEKLAIVTGGTRGIGGAIAKRLLDDGYSCIITGTSKEIPKNLPEKFQYYSIDLKNREAVLEFASWIKLQKPSILVNNVGLNVKGDTTTFSLETYDILQDVNVRAPFILCKAVLEHMISQGWGRIVNITSLWSISPNIKDAAYCASKFGLDGLTSSMAAEVAASNVLINSVAPGFIYTEAAAEAFSEDELISVSKEIPIGRLGRPEEVASLVSWLVSEENTYLTGQNILIDGGLTRTAKP